MQHLETLANSLFMDLIDKQSKGLKIRKDEFGIMMQTNEKCLK